MRDVIAEKQRAAEEDRDGKNGPVELPGPCFSRSPWHVDGNVSTGQGLTPGMVLQRNGLLNRAALLRLRDPVGHPLRRRRALEVVIEELLHALLEVCLLYTSDAADERSSVDLGGRR